MFEMIRVLEIICMEKRPVDVQGDIFYFRMQMSLEKYIHTYICIHTYILNIYILILYIVTCQAHQDLWSRVLSPHPAGTRQYFTREICILN